VGGPCRSPCPAGYRSRQFRWESRDLAYITAYGRSSLVATLVDVFPTTVYCSGAAVGSQQVSYTCLTCPSGCHSPGVALTNREPGGLFWNPEMNPTAFYVAVDLEIPTQVQAVLWAGLGAIDNAPPSLVLSQSADAVTWTQVASVDLTPYVGSSSQTVVALPTPYAAAARYWKMEIVAPASGDQPWVRTLGLCDTSDCAEMPPFRGQYHCKSAYEEMDISDAVDTVQDARLPWPSGTRWNLARTCTRGSCQTTTSSRLADDASYVRTRAAPQYGSSRAINGDIDDYASTCANVSVACQDYAAEADRKWWRVDLEVTQYIDMVRVWAAYGLHPDAASRTFEVRTGDGALLEDNALCALGLSGSKTMIDVKCEKMGRYVFVAAPAGYTSSLNLAEVEVFGVIFNLARACAGGACPTNLSSVTETGQSV